MLERIKHLARRANIRKIAGFVRRTLPLAVFYVKDAFRPSLGDRQEIRFKGKTVIYDVFACDDNNKIALVGHYARLAEVAGIRCTFPSGDVSEATWIDDYAHEHEGEQVLIGFFDIPEVDKRAAEVHICLNSREGAVLAELLIRLPDRSKKNYLSVAVLMNNEDRYLEEWIEYYRILGADHFYIYDNRSSRRNKIRKILAPYRERGIVTLIDWDYPYAVGPEMIWRFNQRGQMHHCLYKYGESNRWMLFIDVDEFVYPLDSTQMSLVPLLKQYDSEPAVSALQFKMIWFGNSGFSTVPPGLVIEHYTHRAAEAVSQGRQKCCVKPDKVELLYIHDIKKCVDGSQKVTVSPDQYRINHYYATSSSRRRRCDDKFNEQQDTGMHRFVDPVKQHIRGE